MISPSLPDPPRKSASLSLRRLDRPLEWLFGIFLLCLVLVFALRGYFNSQEATINQLGANERARLFVGEEVVRSIGLLEKDIYSMALTQNPRSFERVNQSIANHLSKLQNDLDVLQMGGVSRRQLQLNLDGKEQMVREASYLPPPDETGVVLELVEIAPQLATIRRKADDLNQLLQQRWASVAQEDAKAFYLSSEALALQLKTIPPLFERLNENANRLFLEGDQRLKLKEAELQGKSQELKHIETGLISLVVLLGGLSGVLFMRRLTAALRAAEVAQKDTEQQRAQNVTMLNTLGDGVYATDMQGKVTFLNTSGERILGWSAEQLLGQSAHVAVHHTRPDGSAFPMEHCPLLKVFTESLSIEGEEHFVARNGRFVPVSYRSSPLLDGGVAVGSLVSFTDISERIESEARIRLQQAALDAAANMIVITNHDGIIEYVNPAFCSITGYAAHEVVGQHTRKLSSGLHDEGFYQKMWQALLAGQSWEGELSNRRKNGEVYTEQMTITPIIEGRDIAHFVAIKRDISEEIRTRTQLKLIEAAIQDTNQGIHIMEAAPHAQGPIIQYINAGFTRITGYSAPEVLGRRAGFMRGPDTDPAKLALIQDTMRDGGSLTVEMSYQRKDGTPFVGELHLSPVHTDSGQVSHYVGLLSDIELRKQAEAALRDARDQALENSRLKSEFLSTMSHEIRTPMNGIIGMTDLLLDTRLDAQQQDFANIVRESAHALLVIINDILDFSKIEAGKLDIDITDYAITQLVQGSMELLGARAKEKSLQFQSWVDPSLPALLRGDPTRVRQVLLNLLTNAIKFTAQGQVDLKVSRVPGNPEMMRFEVRDTGIGITPATQARLFQSFTQADSSTTRKFGGTGLGLAICKRLVELMGGDIGILSAEGEGSTFWFTLPLEASEHAVPSTLPNAQASGTNNIPHEARPVEPVAAPASAAASATRGLILLAEDNLINQKVAQLQVTKMGYALHIVNNGHEAVQAVEAALAGRAPSYAAVLMDCQMPVLDGFEATALIREAEHQGARARLPIIAMTANAMQGDRERCLASGMDDYLSKPIQPDELRRLLTQWALMPTDAPAAVVSVVTELVQPEAFALINMPHLNDIFGDDPESLQRLLTLFKHSTKAALKKLQSAVAQNNATEVASLSHELKGSCGNMGMARMAHLASALEQAATQSNWAEAASLNQLLVQAFSDTLAACSFFQA
ncbi:PAS domain S-box protein [Rhodoferax sp.]|uniref:PAS domain S-box protein n=1 Tax=Rhodoferax sp. TaxID=50421 RepID=UPI00260C1844|nr:PAS domain S-box protein [Rhodoferax sp.]MDD2811414.1 PAS domain S-box protein [Rhodoferax sp.]MDD4942844.1 PAS domain S-box protein [Rhodoferax sp.]MDD5478702.1 PAS domain S-box protein [Rhodoferax sp.]